MPNDEAGVPGERGEVETPLRAEQRARVRSVLEGWLAGRSVPLSGDESDDDVAHLVSAIEAFENAVIASGGDRMVESGATVLPARRADESAGTYIRRVQASTAAVGRVASRGEEAAGA